MTTDSSLPIGTITMRRVIRSVMRDLATVGEEIARRDQARSEIWGRHAESNAPWSEEDSDAYAHHALHLLVLHRTRELLQAEQYQLVDGAAQLVMADLVKGRAP